MLLTLQVLGGAAVGWICVLLYLRFHPEYGTGRRFSLPFLPICLLVGSHCLLGFGRLAWIPAGFDALFLLEIIASRIAVGARQGFIPALETKYDAQAEEELGRARNSDQQAQGIAIAGVARGAGLQPQAPSSIPEPSVFVPEAEPDGPTPIVRRESRSETSQAQGVADRLRDFVEQMTAYEDAAIAYIQRVQGAA